MEDAPNALIRSFSVGAVYLFVRKLSLLVTNNAPIGVINKLLVLPET